jgi:hypothetical protein
LDGQPSLTIHLGVLPNFFFGTTDFVGIIHIVVWPNESSSPTATEKSPATPDNPKI